MKQNKFISNKQIIIAVFISLIVICFGATQPSSPVVEFKPARPKMVRHVIFTSLEAANEYIEDCKQGGFIIKTVAYANPSIYNGSERVLVVAEKY